jgi:hypothetical protein
MRVVINLVIIVFISAQTFYVLSIIFNGVDGMTAIGYVGQGIFLKNSKTGYSFQFACVLKFVPYMVISIGPKTDELLQGVQRVRLVRSIKKGKEMDRRV